jgi:hypothetical protein
MTHELAVKTRFFKFLGFDCIWYVLMRGVIVFFQLVN